MVQWLRLHAPDAGGLDSIPGLGIRSFIFYAETKDPASHNKVLAWPKKKKKNEMLIIGAGDRYCVCSHSVVSSSLTSPWIVASQAPLSMGFPRKEYWSGLPFPSPGDLPNSGIEPAPLCLLHCRWILYH